MLSRSLAADKRYSLGRMRSDTSNRLATWLLFALLCLVAPVFFFAFVIGGFVPLLVIAAWIFRPGDNGFRVLLFIHLLVYAPLLFLLARVASKKLMSFDPSGVLLVALGGVAFGVSFLPLYGVGHSVKESFNLYQMLVRP